MRSNELKSKALGVGVFVAPILLVNATKVYFSMGGPAEVSAAPQPAAFDPVIPTLPASSDSAPDEEMIAAAAHVEKLRSEPFGDTPLYYEPDVVPDQPEEQVEGPKQDPAPEFVVRAILSSATGDMALIGSEAHREGDTVPGTDWIIVEIDAVKRSVIFEHPRTGRTLRRFVQLPQD